MEIRDGGGREHRVWCPRIPFEALAVESNWSANTNQFPTRKEWIERMVAFDFDQDDHIIAIVSLEPLPRDTKRIARAYDSRIR